MERLLIKNKKIFCLQLIFIAVIIFFFGKNINWSLISSNLNVNFLFGIVFSQLAFIFFILFSVFRYQFLLINKKYSFFQITNAVVLSMGMNYFLPLRSSDILKSTYLKKYHRVSISDSLSASIFEKILDLIALSILFLILVVAQFGHDSSIFLILISLFVCLMFFLIKKNKTTVAIIRKVFQGKAGDFIISLLNNFSIYAQGKYLLNSFVKTLLVWFLLVLGIFSFFVIATNFEVSNLILLYASIGAIVGGMLVFLPGSFGTFEGAIILILHNNGLDFNLSLSLALGLRISLMLISVPWSIGIILNHGTGLKQFYFDLKSPSDD